MALIKFIGNHAGRFPLEIEGTQPAEYRELKPGDTAEVSERQAEKLLDMFPNQFTKACAAKNKRMKKTATFKAK